MRRIDVKPKERRKVTIPTELRESLNGVHYYIVESLRNGDLAVNYEDAIQVGAVCGGRVGTEDRPYVFTYHPSTDTQHGLWHLTLHLTEIEDIGDGIITDLMMYCCTLPDCGRKFREADDTCEKCDYEDETTWFQNQLNQISASATTKQEWVTEYLVRNPDASGLILFRDYNSNSQLVDRLGRLSAAEVKAMVPRPPIK